MQKINFTRKFQRGFTLIELLVVVAIIGILASVVLVALNSAKNKGADAAVKTNLHTVANQAELFFTNGNSFLPVGGTAIAITTPCPTYLPSGTNMFSGNKVVADALAQAVISGNSSSCYNSSSAWAVAVGLKTNSSTSWCVDSTGAARQVAFVPSNAINGSTCK